MTEKTFINGSRHIKAIYHLKIKSEIRQKINILRHLKK